jgi:hypothetical protein
VLLNIGLEKRLLLSAEGLVVAGTILDLVAKRMWRRLLSRAAR